MALRRLEAWTNPVRMTCVSFEQLWICSGFVPFFLLLCVCLIGRMRWVWLLWLEMTVLDRWWRLWMFTMATAGPLLTLFRLVMALRVLDYLDCDSRVGFENRLFWNWRLVWLVVWIGLRECDVGFGSVVGLWCCRLRSRLFGTTVLLLYLSFVWLQVVRSLVAASCIAGFWKFGKFGCWVLWILPPPFCRSRCLGFIVPSCAGIANKRVAWIGEEGTDIQ